MTKEKMLMKAVIVECSFGVLAFNEQNDLVDRVLFSKKPQETAKTLMDFEAGKIIKEIAELIERLKKNGYDSFIFEKANIATRVQEKFKVNVEIVKQSSASEILRSNMGTFAVQVGFVKNVDEFTSWMHALSMEIAKLKVKGAAEKRDLLIAQAIQTLDDLDKSINLFMARVREWYGIHFPELDRLIDKHETYARLVLELGAKENLTAEALTEREIPTAKAEQIARIAKASMGADLTESDLTQIQNLCRNIINLYELRGALEKYLDETMEEVAPNVKALTGSLLGARLIALAGGLTNLAKRPASTIQVLGAEKALFRSLKTGTRPPKHGIIFQHTYLHEAKRWHRGKIARAFAGKLAIAARIDAFGSGQVSENLKASLERRIEEIREKYAEPPPVQEKKTLKHEKRRRKERRERKR